jgi:N-acetylneuraminic acid mutarotase
MRFPLLVLFLLFNPSTDSRWTDLPPLPSAVTNNAVAGYVHKDRVLIYSFMGMGKDKNYSAITTNAMVYDSLYDGWRLLPPVPGKRGRIGASAVTVDGQVFVLGGYTVDEKGTETTVGDVDVYTPSVDEPTQGYWAKGIPIPIPVSDAVTGVVNDRFILLISGWSKNGAIPNVQIYDTLRDHWRPGSVIAGKPVFGHAGAIVNKTILYCGGAFVSTDQKDATRKAEYVASDECWQGKITATGPFKMLWNQLSSPPGAAHYRMAAGASGKKIVFTGGTAAPYNFDGVGYSGKPAVTSATTFAWDTDKHAWQMLPDDPHPTMDTRSLVADQSGVVLVGGMQAGQKVEKRAAHLSLPK